MRDSIGEYYKRCREQLHEARVKLADAKCNGCFGGLGWTDGRDPKGVEFVCCDMCGGTGRAKGVSYEELRRLRQNVDQAMYVGD